MNLLVAQLTANQREDAEAPRVGPIEASTTPAKSHVETRVVELDTETRDVHEIPTPVDDSERNQRAAVQLDFQPHDKSKRAEKHDKQSHNRHERHRSRYRGFHSDHKGVVGMSMDTSVDLKVRIPMHAFAQEPTHNYDNLSLAVTRANEDSYSTAAGVSDDCDKKKEVAVSRTEKHDAPPLYCSERKLSNPPLLLSDLFLYEHAIGVDDTLHETKAWVMADGPEKRLHALLRGKSADCVTHRSFSDNDAEAPKTDYAATMRPIEFTNLHQDTATTVASRVEILSKTSTVNMSMVEMLGSIAVYQNPDELHAVSKDVLLTVSKLVRRIEDDRAQREGTAIVAGKTESNTTALNCQWADRFMDRVSTRLFDDLGGRASGGVTGSNGAEAPKTDCITVLHNKPLIVCMNMSHTADERLVVELSILTHTETVAELVEITKPQPVELQQSEREQTVIATKNSDWNSNTAASYVQLEEMLEQLEKHNPPLIDQSSESHGDAGVSLHVLTIHGFFNDWTRECGRVTISTAGGNNDAEASKTEHGTILLPNESTTVLLSEATVVARALSHVEIAASHEEIIAEPTPADLAMEELEHVAVHQKDSPHDKPDETGEDQRRTKEEAVEGAAEAVPAAPPEKNKLERQQVEQFEEATPKFAAEPRNRDDGIPPLTYNFNEKKAVAVGDVQFEEQRASLPNRHELRFTTRLSPHIEAVKADSTFSNLKVWLVVLELMQEWTDNGEIVSRKPARDMAADELTRQLQSVSFRHPSDIQVKRDSDLEYSQIRSVL